MNNFLYKYFSIKTDRLYIALTDSKKKKYIYIYIYIALTNDNLLAI